MNELPQTASSGIFPTTLWTQIIAGVRKEDEDAAVEALQKFCLSYRQAIFNFFRRHRCSPDAAEEYTAKFFETQIHERWGSRKGFLFTVKRQEQKKFRGFLCAVLWNFLRDQWKAEGAAKRGGGLEFSSIEGMDLPDGDVSENVPETFVCEFDRILALEIIGHAAGDSGRSKYLIGHLRGDITQEEAAVELGMTPNAFKQAYSRFRENLRHNLLKEVRKLVGPDEKEVKEEIKYLMSLFSKSPA